MCLKQSGIRLRYEPRSLLLATNVMTTAGGYGAIESMTGSAGMTLIVRAKPAANW